MVVGGRRWDVLGGENIERCAHVGVCECVSLDTLSGREEIFELRLQGKAPMWPKLLLTAPTGTDCSRTSPRTNMS